ncbi:MAG TPA: DNA polymerase III subunit beta [Clostridiales bacterium]|nr:DNA polymerase III subunit beta [Clostridiales bacterium]HOL91786.1 DNA polymerase III subunit beta [Clostridiales bacterium]HPP35351.1 DNA polymerase III subunit beta [Clostridiales bacterium]
MKIICSKEKLLEGINIVQKAVSAKTPLPILEGILVEAGDQVKLTSNDLEIGIECIIEADVREEGAIVLNARMFGEIIRKFPDAEVLIEVRENNNVVIECENSMFEIRGLDAEGFPALPTLEKKDGIKISQRMLKDMIRQTIFAVSTDENRPMLTGSLFEYKDGKFTIVSIDGYRLAMRCFEPENENETVSAERKFVIPGKTLNEIAKILQPVDDDIYIYAAGNQILFDMGNCIMTSRLLEGEYLNYMSIFPKDHETKVRVNTKDLLSCFERASLVITSEERRYPVSLDITEKKIVITANTEAGNVREELKIDMEGKRLEISFYHKFFIEALRAIDNETIDIYFTTSLGPCTIKPLQGNDFAYLILPIRR